MNSIEVGTFEAKKRPSELLDRVERGQRVVITRRGKRVAILSAPVESEQADPGLTADTLAEEFRRLRQRGRPGQETIRDLIEEGRIR